MSSSQSARVQLLAHFRGRARDDRARPGLARGGTAMGDTDATDATYGFGSGIGDDEMARLEVQGAATAQATRMIFIEAGIRPGMRVLDLGSGAGDTAFLAAD